MFSQMKTVHDFLPYPTKFPSRYNPTFSAFEYAFTTGTGLGRGLNRFSVSQTIGSPFQTDL